MTLTGTAVASANSNDVADITFSFQNAAFTNTPAVDVTNATGPASSGLGVNFRDITLSYSVNTFTEGVTLDGSIDTVITTTLAGDTFTVPAGVLTQGTHYSVSNIPAGLTAVVTGTSATTVSIALSGNAVTHSNANDIANLGIVFSGAAFTKAPASNIAGSSKSDFVVDFGDATITYSGS